MKLLLILLFATCSYAQEYSFEEVLDKSMGKNQTIQLKGQVTLTQNHILITTHNGTKKLDILGSLPYYIQRKTIYRCQDENENTIRVFWIWTEQTRNIISMILISDNTTYTFNLTHKKSS